MDHVGTALTKSCLSRRFLYSNFLFISFTLQIPCCKLICRNYKHASTSFLYENTPSLVNKSGTKKGRGYKVFEKLTENLSGMATFFDPSGKLSMMCMIPVSITIFESHCFGFMESTNSFKEMQKLPYLIISGLHFFKEMTDKVSLKGHIKKEKTCIKKTRVCNLKQCSVQHALLDVQLSGWYCATEKDMYIGCGVLVYLVLSSFASG